MKQIRWVASIILIGLMGLLAACGESENPAPLTEMNEAVEAEGETAVVEGEPAAAAYDKYALPMGQTAEGAFYIGGEDAPVTILDYSNFL